ncbi:MAG: hypothetical protein QNK03_04845 [Myxococcota bacterium]|nr:hypothetical protein [Myxococcota bacterium]
MTARTVPNLRSVELDEAAQGQESRRSSMRDYLIGAGFALVVWIVIIAASMVVSEAPRVQHEVERALLAVDQPRALLECLSRGCA